MHRKMLREKNKKDFPIGWASCLPSRAIPPRSGTDILDMCSSSTLSLLETLDMWGIFVSPLKMEDGGMGRGI